MNLHFRTDSVDHRVLLCRYALLLYLYAEQLRVIFSAILCTSACETDEGGISVVNRHWRGPTTFRTKSTVLRDRPLL